jgi:hypothetical protein
MKSKIMRLAAYVVHIEAYIEVFVGKSEGHRHAGRMISKRILEKCDKGYGLDSSG